MKWAKRRMPSADAFSGRYPPPKSARLPGLRTPFDQVFERSLGLFFFRSSWFPVLEFLGGIRCDLVGSVYLLHRNHKLVLVLEGMKKNQLYIHPAFTQKFYHPSGLIIKIEAD